MNKTIKRIFAIILAAITVFSVLTVSGFAGTEKNKMIFSIATENIDTDKVEVTLKLETGNISCFDLQMVAPEGYTLESINESEAMREGLTFGYANMAYNIQNGKVGFTSLEGFDTVGEMLTFVYKRDSDRVSSSDDFKVLFSCLCDINNENATAIVFYNEIDDLSVNVYPNNRELKYKDYDMITVGVTGSMDCDVSFSSSNPRVVKVDENGNIYAAKRGSATITCTVTDSEGNVASDSYNVKVNYSFGQWLIKILLFGWIWY